MADTDTAKRRRILSLIRELQKHTTENGCTEAEALLAAEKISQLLLEYQLVLTDLNEIEEALYATFARVYGGGTMRRRSWHETRQTWHAVACFTDTQYWCRDNQLIFFGCQTDCEIAFFLCDLFKNTSEVEWQTFRRLEQGRTDRRGRASFMAGFCSRISERLKQLKNTRGRNGPEPAKSHALVVLKDQLLAQKFSDYQRKTGLRLRLKSRSPTFEYDFSNYRAGADAGNRTTITVGIGKDPLKYL